MEVAFVPCPTVASTTFCTNINIEESVVGISEGQENNAVELLVIEEQGPSMLWFSYGYMFPIEGTNTVMVVPLLAETIGNL